MKAQKLVYVHPKVDKFNKDNWYVDYVVELPNHQGLKAKSCRFDFLYQAEECLADFKLELEENKNILQFIN